MKFFRLQFLFVFLFGPTAAWCGDGIHGSSGTNRTLFMAGYTNFRPYALNDRYALTGENQFLQLTTFGIGTTSALSLNRGSDVDGAFSLLFYNPAQITSPLDSSVLSVRGWELMTSLYGYDILKSVKAVDFVIAPGVYWGKVKLEREAQIAPNLKMRYKNPFIAPMLRIDLRFNFWRMSIGGRASFRYDITNARWHERDGDLIDMPGYRFREAQYVVYIGIKLVNEDRFSSSQDTGDDLEN